MMTEYVPGEALTIPEGMTVAQYRHNRTHPPRSFWARLCHPHRKAS